MQQPNTTSPSHLAQVFYQQTLAQRNNPLLWQLSHARLAAYTRGEAAEWISAYVRGLESARIARGARVAMIGAPDSMRLLILIAHAMMGITTVIAPDSLPLESRVRLLRETHCSLALVDDGAHALELLGQSSGMPELQAILGLRGTMRLPSQHLITLSIDALLQRGRNLPDRISSMLSLTKTEEAALILGLPQADDSPRNHRAMRTHTELMADCERLLRLLSDAHVQIPYGAPVLVCAHSGSMPAFIASQLLPLYMGSSIDYAHPESIDISRFRMLQPSLLVGDSSFLHTLQKQLEVLLIDRADLVDRTATRQLLRLGKKRYEQSGTLNRTDALAFRIAQHAVAQRIREFLGANLQGILCTDDALHYSTMLFYDTFGIRVTEIPSVFHETFEKTRL